MLYNTVYEMENLKKFWDDMFNDGTACTDTSRFGKANIYQNDEAYMIQIAASGIKSDSLDITYKDGVLSIKAEREKTTKDDSKQLLNELAKYALSRTFTLNDKVDVEKIEAKLTDGVLRVTLPKLEEAKAKTIEVKVN